MGGPPEDADRSGMRLAVGIATIVGAVATVVGVVITVVLAWWPDTETDVMSPTPGASSVPEVTAGDECGQSGNPCVSDYLAVAVDDCSLPGVLAAWGMDPQLDSLLIDTAAHGDNCLITPNQKARDAGASVDDVESAQDGAPADSLRECARRTGDTIVACSELHEIEFVGPPFDSSTDSDPGAKCSASARRYASISFGPGREVNYGVINTQDGASARCALIVERGSSDKSLRSPMK